MHACELNNARMGNIDRSMFLSYIYLSHLSIDQCASYATKMITLILIIGTIEDLLNHILN